MQSCHFRSHNTDTLSFNIGALIIFPFYRVKPQKQNQENNECRCLGNLYFLYLFNLFQKYKISIIASGLHGIIISICLFERNNQNITCNFSKCIPRSLEITETKTGICGISHFDIDIHQNKNVTVNKTHQFCNKLRHMCPLQHTA